MLSGSRDYSYAPLVLAFAGALRAAGLGVARLWSLVVLLAAAACVRELVSPADPAARDRALFFVVTLAIGIPGTFLLLHFLRLPTQIWYYQSLLAALALCADGALALRGEVSRAETGAKLVLAVCAIALGAPAEWRSRTASMTNVDVIADRLDREAAPEDLILVQREVSPTFDRYYGGPARWITFTRNPESPIPGYAHGQGEGCSARRIRSDPNWIASPPR